jgi:cell division protein FtsZ
MRGARGLLISITGGKDLTLYEVDEAATRIREEVDADANIILGATFDQSLDGLVRVSVVATGIESLAAPNAAAVRERAGSEPARMGIGAARVAIEQRREATLRENDFADEAPAAPEIEVDEVTLRPLQPRPSLFHPVEEALHPADIQEEPITPFIPPQAERPAMRPPRLPRIEDFPPHAQNQLRARHGELGDADVEKKRMTLLERLANRFNKSEAEDVASTHQLRPLPKPREPDPRPATDRRLPEQVSEYGRRPASRGLPLDAPRPASSRGEEDELEIPAFLRRQAH